MKFTAHRLGNYFCFQQNPIAFFLRCFHARCTHLCRLDFDAWRLFTSSNAFVPTATALLVIIVIRQVQRTFMYLLYIVCITMMYFFFIWMRLTWPNILTCSLSALQPSNSKKCKQRERESNLLRIHIQWQRNHWLPFAPIHTNIIKMQIWIPSIVQLCLCSNSNLNSKKSEFRTTKSYFEIFFQWKCFSETCFFFV